MLTGYLSPGKMLPQKWWPDGSSFATDFVRNRAASLGQNIASTNAYTFARATEKLVSDGNGNWSNVHAGELAVADDGATIEPAFTELGSYTDTNTATVGTLGSGGSLPAGWTETATSSGVTVEILAAGDHKGLPSIDLRFSGTPTNHWRLRPGGVAECDATPLSDHIATLFCSLIGGSLPNPSSFQFGPIWYTVASGYLAAGLKSIGGDIDASFRRFSKLSSSPVTAAKANLDFFSATNGIPIDFSIRLAAPNLGIGALPTSPVLSAGAPKTRAADVLTLYLPTGNHRLTLETNVANEEITGPIFGNHILTPPSSGAPVKRVIGNHYTS